MGAAECLPVVTDLGCDAAYLILEPYFDEVRAVFVAHERTRYGSSRLQHTRLECDALVHSEAGEIDGCALPRHFAGCSEDGRLIIAAPELAELPEQTVVAIFAHEFGHALDFAHPARWAMEDGVLVERELPKPSDKRRRQIRLAAVNQWRARDDYTVEITADQLAEMVMGRPIGYTGPCWLQSFGGVRRPEGLR